MIFLERFFNKRNEVSDGEYRISDVPFFSQRLDENNFRNEGFSDIENAKYWADRICGLACLKMVIAKFCNANIPLKELLDRGIANGAYKDHVGWIHKGLVALAQEYGLDGGTESIGTDLKRIAGHVSKDRLIVASVAVGFEAGKEYVNDDGGVYIVPRGGHLVTIFGTDVVDGHVKNFLLHHPSSWESYEHPSQEISGKLFGKSFSERGNIMYFNKK